MGSPADPAVALGCENCQRWDFVPHGAQADTIQLLDVWVSVQRPYSEYDELRTGWDWGNRPRRWCAACWQAAQRRGESQEGGKLVRGDVGRMRVDRRGRSTYLERVRVRLA